MANFSEKVGKISTAARLKLAYASILGLKRGDYKSTWNRISKTKDLAMIGVAGTADSSEFFSAGKSTADTIAEALRLGSNDQVLEIGCGVARIGKFLAPRIRTWIGADISGEMLKIARGNLEGIANCELIELVKSDLSPFEDCSLDKVYCSAVFMHLDEWDRYRYVAEAFRVLRMGGECYFDNINLAGDIGWDIFTAMSRHDPLLRPANISKSSTTEELKTYLARAGFVEIREFPGSHFVAVAGKKPLNN